MSPSKRSGRGSAPSQRQLRVGELVRRAVSDILMQGEIHDPALEGIVVTVPEVRMSPDLSVATIFIMPLGGKDGETVVAAFERSRKFLRGAVARRVDLRHAPDLNFLLDTSFDEGDKIDALLRSPDVKRDLDKDE
jgi:ribosome-binding factor A